MDVKIKDNYIVITFKNGKKWMSLEASSGPCKLFVHSSESPNNGNGINDSDIYDFLKKYVDSIE